MHLFQRTLLQGAHDRLVDAGRMLPIATEKLATEVFDKIASDIGLPVMLDTRPNQKQAEVIGNLLIDYSQKLAQQGYGPDQDLMNLAKTASTRDPAERAHIVAEYYIQKAAEENSLHPSGPTGLAAAAQYDLLAAQDVANRHPGAYAVQQGQSNFAMPGVVGRELGAPGAPTTGANVKVADTSPGDWSSLPDNFPQPYAVPRPNAGRLPTNPQTPGFLRQVGQELSSSPMAHYRHWGDRTGWGKAKSVAAVGTQGLGVGAGLVGLGAGARALYRHFSPAEEAKAASLKQALDMPDFNAMGASVMARARSLKDSVASGATNLKNTVMTNHIPSIQQAQDELAKIRAVPGDVGLIDPDSGLGAHNIPDHHQAWLAQRNTGLRGVGIQAATGLAGLGLAGGLAYGGKKLYDHLQGSPEDMEVNASDGSAEALAQSLHEHGIEPTPDLIASLMAAMDEEDAAEGAAEGAPDAGAPPMDPAKAASEGSLHPTPAGNSLRNAAKVDPLAKVDVKNRAPGSHEVPQGQTSLSTAAGEIGAEKKAEIAWRQNLINCAQTYGGYLPAAWPEQVKHAAIQEIAAQPPSNRAAFVQKLVAR